MLVAESVLVITLFCSPTKRRQTIDSPSPPEGIHVVGYPLSIHHLSGNTLEAATVDEIEKMPGVVSVSAKRRGGAFDLFVVMENMDFEPFNAVIQKKVALFEKYPGFTFNFDLTPMYTSETEES